MKRKILQSVTAIVFAVAVFAAFPSDSRAATVQWNTHDNDCMVVGVGNYTTQQGGTNGPNHKGVTNSNCWWNSGATANAGETISVRMYYDNTGDTPATNTKLRLAVPLGSSTTKTFNGYVSSDFGGGISGSGSINLTSAQTLTFSEMFWYPENTVSNAVPLPGGQSGQELFGQGLNVGTVQPWTTCAQGNAYCHKGAIVVRFVVGSSTTPGGASCAITSFSAAPTQINAGSTATLYWSTTGCTSVTLTGGSLSGNRPTSGQANTGVLNNSTNYTLTATGSTGSVSKTVTVNVQGQQASCLINSFAANPSQVTSGSSSTLSWSTTNCGQVVISGGNFTGNQSLTGSANTGVLSGTTNYTLTAYPIGGGTPATQTVTVTVNPVQQACLVNSFNANPSSIASGSSTTLTWSTTGCTSVSIAGTGVAGAQSLSGSLTTGSIFQSTSYVLTAMGSNGTPVTQTVYVTVNQQTQQCTISSFYASPTQVTNGGSSTIYWNTSNCTSATVQGPNVFSQNVSGQITTGAVYGSNSYTLTAYGSNTVTQTITVSANTQQQCVINNFYASPNQVVSGGSSTIFWNISGNGTVTVSGPGVYSTQQSGSLLTGAIYSNATYTITANCGGSSVNQTIVVTISGNTGSGVAAITTTPTNVVSSSARLNGLVISNNVGSVNAYFEYGTTAALGLETSQQFVSASASNFFSTIATAPNTTYYYRAVVLSNGILYRGSIVSFTSSTDIVVTGGPNIVRPVIVVQGGGVGGGSPLVTLTINDQLQTVARGDIITYLVTYQNISGQTLSNVILNVILPTGVLYRSSSNGVLTTNNTVAASVGTLPPNAQGSMTIQASINETVANGSSLVATATLAFTTPSLAQDSAIAYDIDTVASRNALAGLAFWGGFFPNTLLGWIILLIIILLLILLARRYRDRYYRTVPAPMYGPQHGNQPPAPQYNYYGPAPAPQQPAAPMHHQAHAPAPQPMHAPAPQQHGGYYPENLPH